MAKGINKAIILGNLGQDPEVKYSQSGSAITTISVATSESWTDKQSGQKQEKTEWHRIVFFNKLAEIVGEYLRKGSQVYVEGKITTRKWQDQQGQDKYTTEIVANEMQMLGGRGDNTGGGMSQGGGQQQGGGYGQQSPQQAPAQPAYNAPAQQGGGYQPPAAQPAAQPNYAAAPQQSAPQQSAAAPNPAPAMDSFDDDIPF